MSTFSGMGAQAIGGGLKVVGAFYLGVVFGCLLCAALDYLEYQRGAVRYRPTVPKPRKLSVFEIQEILNTYGDFAGLPPGSLNSLVNRVDVNQYMKNPRQVGVYA